MDRWTRVRAAGSTVVVVGALTVGSAAALTYQWSWAEKYSNVNATNRVFAYHAPDAVTAQQPAHELSARRDKNDDSAHRARAAVRARFPAVSADGVRVTSFGRTAEAGLDPPARLRVWVHCDGELVDEWVRVGQTDVATTTNAVVLVSGISVEDCETQTVDGVMLQVMAGDEGQRRKRTVFLKRAELWQGGAATWTEDFTAP
jgi:hypothetical protein